MKTVLMVSLVSVLALSGCATVGMRGAFDDEGLPKAKYYVGGGFRLEYRASAAGTAYLVEAESGKMIATQSLKPNELFEADIDLQDDDVHMQLKTIGIDPLNLNFKLYFVPNEEIHAEAGE